MNIKNALFKNQPNFDYLSAFSMLSDIPCISQIKVHPNISKEQYMTLESFISSSDTFHLALQNISLDMKDDPIIVNRQFTFGFNRYLAFE